MYSLDDTIAAIATPIGTGGVGIIRLSGPDAYAIICKIFQPKRQQKTLRPHILSLGKIIDPATTHQVDESMVVFMPRPHSYTCQDVVEIQAHGSLVALQQILQLVLRFGARPAEAGEMTLRAFLNGRIDLTQAEAVLDIIEAKTGAALRVANEQLDGGLSQPVRDLRLELLDTLAFLEASVDFVEEDIPVEEVIPPLETVRTKLTHLIDSSEQGLIYRQGVRVAIVGRPNVGKSSLLNALLRGNRAIVTDIPGTTRDTLEETINLRGVPVIVVDTAGIRAEAADAVERIGIERSQAAVKQADLVLLVVDGSQAITPSDYQIADLVGQKNCLLVANKADLPSLTLPPDFMPTAPKLQMSALTQVGVDNLEDLLLEQITGGKLTLADTPLVSNPRHKALLEQALDLTQAAIEAQTDGLSPDLVSIDVRGAVDALGDITGETISEDLLDTIFSRFCIGK